MLKEMFGVKNFKVILFNGKNECENHSNVCLMSHLMWFKVDKKKKSNSFEGATAPPGG